MKLYRPGIDQLNLIAERFHGTLKIRLSVSDDLAPRLHIIAVIEDNLQKKPVFRLRCCVQADMISSLSIYHRQRWLNPRSLIIYPGEPSFDDRPRLDQFISEFNVILCMKEHLCPIQIGIFGILIPVYFPCFPRHRFHPALPFWFASKSFRMIS